MGKGSSGSVSTHSKLSPEQQQVAKMLGGGIEAGLGEGGINYPYDIASLTPEQFFDAYNKYFTTDRIPISGGLSELVSGKPAFATDPRMISDYFETNVAKPSLEAFQRNIQPIIEEQFAGAYASSGRRKAVSRAVSDMANRLSDQLFSAQMMGLQMTAAGEEAAEQRRLPAMQFATALPYQEFGQAAGAAGMKQQAVQADIDKMTQLWAREQPWASPWMKQAQQFIGTPSMEVVAQQGQQSPWSNPLTYLGLAAFGPAALSNLGGALGMGGTAAAGGGTALGGLTSSQLQGIADSWLLYP